MSLTLAHFFHPTHAQGPQKKDVINGSSSLAVRRRSLSASMDGASVVRKYYFKLTGHLLAWYEMSSVEANQDVQNLRGMVSLLSIAGIRRLTKEDALPGSMSGGFVLQGTV
jgi:hypothetical protein